MPRNDLSAFDGARARAARTANAYSQQQVAQSLGVAKSTVTMWETGARRPASITVTERLAGLLGVPLEQLLPGAEPPAGATLATIRRHLRLTRSDIAEQVGATVRTVERVENGDRLPDSPADWARAYGLTMGELAEAVAHSWRETHGD
jgi:transcriptional regulator with XRE-family HTH domain